MGRARHVLVAAAAVVALIAAALYLYRSRVPVPASTRGGEDEAAQSPVPAPAQREPVANLDDVLVLSGECETAEPLSSIVERLTVIDPLTFEGRPPPPVAIPGAAVPVAPQFERTVDGNERQVTIDLPLPGRWRGLHVTRLRRTFSEESDVSAIEIHFRDPPDRVRGILNRSGFQLPPVGQWRTIDPESEVGTHVSVGALDGGATLVCATG